MLPDKAKEYPVSEATNVLDKDWDVLVILDACRFDTFQKVVKDCKDTDFIISPASSSGEWIHNTFDGTVCKDIIYVTGTPWVTEHAIVDQPGQQNLGYNPFYKILIGHQYDILDYSETSNPVFMTDAAELIKKKYPDKRLIIHNMQPHFPYMGKHKIRPKDWEPLRKEMFRLDKTIRGEEFRFGDYKPENSLWNVMKEGIVSREEVLKAYEDNLRYVLEQLPRWRKLGKKVFITADHGSCFLDYGIDGHPSGMRVEELVKVPWYEVKQ